MDKNDWIFLGVTILLIAILVYISSLVIIVAGKEIVVAIIGLAGIILAAVLKYTTELEQSRQEAIRIERQKNYQKLLEKVGDFIRNPSEKDAISVVHIESWVFGDPKVVVNTNKLIAAPTVENLKSLLRSMRDSVELPSLTDEDLEGYDFDQLFPPKQQTMTVPGLKK